MNASPLDERTRISIELALTAHSADASIHRQQDLRARALGLSGAEIDAARRGGSFDARTAIAVSLATATGQDPRRHREQIGRARGAGISEQACADIAALAARFGQHQPQEDDPCHQQP